MHVESMMAIRDAASAVIALQQHPRGDRDVVEDAETLAAIAKGMMGAAGKVHRDPLVERRPRGGDGSADAAARTLDHGRRPRKADPALMLARQPSFEHRCDVARVVHQPQIVADLPAAPRRSVRRDETVGDHALAQPAVLRHRELVRPRAAAARNDRE